MAVSTRLLTKDFSDAQAANFTTASILPIANEVTFVCVGLKKATSTTQPTITGCGITWSLVKALPDASFVTGRSLYVFSGFNASPTTGALTIACGSNHLACFWAVIGLTGADTSGTAVRSVANDAFAQALTVTLAAFSSANNATFGVTYWNHTTAITEGSGFTEVCESNGSNGLQVQFRNDNDTTVDWTYAGGSNKNCGGIAIEIKAGTVNNIFSYIMSGGAAVAGAATCLLSSAANVHSYLPQFPSTISLAWNANTEFDLSGYRIKWGTSSGSYPNSLDVGNVLAYGLTGLSRGTTYFFVLVAYDATGNTSANSAELQATPSQGAALAGGSATTQLAHGAINTFTYAMSGGFVSGGSASVSLTVCYEASGGVTTGGAALCTFSKRFDDSLIVLIEIDLDDNTRYYSHEGVSTPGAWYKDQIISIGAIRRESPYLVGDYRMADVDIVLSNTDLEFSIIKATQAFRNRTVRVRIGSSNSGFVNLNTVFTGKIGAWKFEKGTFTITARDVSFDALNVQIPGRITSTDFPDFPANQELRLLPILYGRIESETGQGAIQCQRINNEAPFEYLVARHACKDIHNVFNYGVRMVGGFEEVTRAIGIYNCQLLRFAIDPQDPDRLNEFEITADVSGKTDDGSDNGVLIENPADQIQDYLINEVGIDISTLDATSFAMVRASAETLGLIGAMAILDSNKTHLQVLEDFSQSFNVPLYTSRFGQYRLYLFNPDDLATTTAIAELTDQSEVLRDSMVLDAPEDAASRLQYNYGYNYVKDYFERQPDLIDAAEQSALSLDVRSNVDLWAVRDVSTALQVSGERLSFMHENTQLAHFSVPIDFFALELNDYFRLSHFQGVAADGGGYQQVVFRVVGISLKTEVGSMQIDIDAVKLSSGIDFWLQYMKLGDETEISSSWLTATASDKQYAYLGDETDNTLNTTDPIKRLT